MAKFNEKMQEIEYSIFNFAKSLTNVNWTFEIGAVQR